ncbi:MAG TPA: isochorismatase family cysteine hydrolase [Gemmatimonadales bacterium]|nr:isochorismatase family cysteine hydrolase [Gemmatimonadales bacterium]
MSDDSDLHGSAPDNSPVALLLIDVINDLEFADGDKLARYALPMAPRLAAFATRARQAGIPVLYVNDNFGKWRSDFHRLLAHCLDEDVRGRPLARQLHPAAEDYFVLKPKHSAFFATTLDTLLKHLGARTVILTGLATNICVYFTAADAVLRDLRLYVPGDCCAANTEEDHRWALDQMQRVLHADISDSTALDLDALIRQAAQH